MASLPVWVTIFGSFGRAGALFLEAVGSRGLVQPCGFSFLIIFVFDQGITSAKSASRWCWGFFAMPVKLYLTELVFLVQEISNFQCLRLKRSS